MIRAGGAVIYLSMMLSAANILGSSGLMMWIDYSIGLNLPFLGVYTPLAIYLLGLSSGCFFVGWLSYGWSESLVWMATREAFVLLCGSSLAVCTILSVGDGVLNEWLDYSLRFYWGVMSGMTVVLARSLLVLPGNDDGSHLNFSILSLALACLPLIFPVLLALGGFYQRSASAVGAAGLYLICAIVAGRMKVDRIVEHLGGDGAFHHVPLVELANLITLNICFFLLLMLVPMVNGLASWTVDIDVVYIGLLVSWVVLGVGCMRVATGCSRRVRFKAGLLVQCSMLLFGGVLVFNESVLLFGLVIGLAFLATMLLQPILYLALGRCGKYNILLFGVQSGLYILIVCGSLLALAYVEPSIQRVFGIFMGLATLSLGLSCWSFFRGYDWKTPI